MWYFYEYYFNGLSNTQTLVGLGTDYVAANACWNYKDVWSSSQRNDGIIKKYATMKNVLYNNKLIGSESNVQMGSE